MGFAIFLLLLQVNVELERTQEEIWIDEVNLLLQETDFIELSQDELIINHEQTIKRILCAYGNDVKRQILFLMAETPLTVSELIKKTNYPISTLYRGINELFADGLILKASYNKSVKRTSTRYIALIRNMKADIDNAHMSFSIKINRVNTTNENNRRQIL